MTAPADSPNGFPLPKPAVEHRAGARPMISPALETARAAFVDSILRREHAVELARLTNRRWRRLRRALEGGRHVR